MPWLIPEPHIIYYLASTEVERLGLTLEKGYVRVKAIHSASQPVSGIAKSVLIKVGPYLMMEGPTFVVITRYPWCVPA